MILLIDIGNTTVAVYEADIHDKHIGRHYRTATDKEVNYIEFFIENKCASEITGCIICSVVPAVTELVSKGAEIAYHIKPYVLTYKDIPININVDEPMKVGMDRLVNAYYAYSKQKLPAVTVDFGTATTIGVITKDGFLGGSISAGVRTSLDAISGKGAQLFATQLANPLSSIGKNTKECLNIGAVCGAAAMLNGMAKLIERELKQPVTVYVTGGYVSFLEKYIEHSHILIYDMLAEGMLMLANDLEE